ncbi:MAG TPA: hypothetical protein VHO69_15585 [Phototrophicaceae bacterium]|nr:hypothetical protein [Phototrophicaceae bacterium]
MQTVTADEARQRLLAGLPFDEDFQIAGELDLSGETSLTAISPRLQQAWSLNLEGCTHLTSLPDGLHVHRLNLNGCTALKQLPAGLVAHSLQAKNSGLMGLPDDVQVAYKIDLSDCKALVSLPNNLHTGSLIIKGCTGLERLPDGLHFYFLDASNCTHLKTWGADGHVEVGNLNLSGCTRLTYLPDWLDKIAQLNLRGCTELQQLPANLTVVSVIEVAESGLTAIPPGCADAELRWRDVLVDERIAFHPETLTAQEIMDEANIERRRVMLDRLGYEAFFKEAQAKELDRDVDPGGIRRLLQVEFQDKDRWRRDEPVVCLSVICPSTARHYIIRVPPTMQTCRQAAAWIAGFDNPEQYNPVQET